MVQGLAGPFGQHANLGKMGGYDTSHPAVMIDDGRGLDRADAIGAGGGKIGTKKPVGGDIVAYDAALMPKGPAANAEIVRANNSKQLQKRRIKTALAHDAQGVERRVEQLHIPLNGAIHFDGGV